MTELSATKVAESSVIIDTKFAYLSKTSLVFSKKLF